jgi:hypothetical protein
MRSYIGFVRAMQLVCILAFCLALVGCGGSKVSKVNYDKIKDGMTVAEVEGILGKGEEQASVSVPGASAGGVSVPGMSGKNYVWKDGTKVITITFLNDKVSAKAQAGL